VRLAEVGGVEGVADPYFRCAFGETMQKTVVDAVLHKDTRAIGADLPGGIEIGKHRAAHGVLDIGVVENDQRRLAAKLHRRVLHLRSRQRQHFLHARRVRNIAGRLPLGTGPDLLLDGVADRVETVVSTLERIDFDDRFDLVTINISMHEARDLERVTRNVHRALRDGGHFVISDLPFPDTDEGLRTVPGRLMSGIQYFEALIGDQLLPTSRYVELLEDAGFEQVDSFQLTPVHVVVHGVK
jgi:SAM-dependent methyltransferase